LPRRLRRYESNIDFSRVASLNDYLLEQSGLPRRLRRLSEPVRPNSEPKATALPRGAFFIPFGSLTHGVARVGNEKSPWP